jgi:hypothetical protein
MLDRTWLSNSQSLLIDSHDDTLDAISCLILIQIDGMNQIIVLTDEYGMWFL